VKTKTEDGETALDIAATYRHPDVVQILLKAGAKWQIENICPAFVGAEWCLGNRQEDAKTKMMEYVRRGESLDRWTELITLITAKGVTSIGLDQWLPVVRELSKVSCGEGYSFEERDHVSINGLPAIVYVVHCEKLAKIPGAAKSVWGKPETSVHLDIIGNQNLYCVQRAARRSDLSEATISQWINWLEAIKVCDSEAPVPPCSQ
jgi:hypothetical protein